MAYIFEEWTKMLEKFQQCVDKGVEESAADQDGYLQPSGPRCLLS